MKNSKAINYAHDMKYKITRFTVLLPSTYPLHGHVHELVLSQSVTITNSTACVEHAHNRGSWAGWALLGRRQNCSVVKVYQKHLHSTKSSDSVKC